MAYAVCATRGAVADFEGTGSAARARATIRTCTKVLKLAPASSSNQNSRERCDCTSPSQQTAHSSPRTIGMRCCSLKQLAHMNLQAAEQHKRINSRQAAGLTQAVQGPEPVADL